MRIALLLGIVVVSAIFSAAPARSGSTMLEQREAEALAKFPTAARRDGCQLILIVGSGKHVNFDDYSAACPDPPWKKKFPKADWGRYFLEAYKPECHLFIVLARYDENDDYVLVDAHTGRHTNFFGSVDVSPACTTLLEVTPESEIDADQPNAIRIWRRNGDRFVRKWMRRLEWNFSPGFARWDGEDRVMLSCSLSTRGDEQFAIHRRGGRWQIDPAQKAYCLAQLLR